MGLTNKWVGYIDRTYQQIKQAVITKMASETPEITDHTESNPYIKQISIWAGMTEHLNYYIDNAAREAFLATARQLSSLVKIAQFANYRIRGMIAATADLTFTLSQPLNFTFTIPLGTTAQTQDGISFITLTGVSIPAGQTSVTVSAKQIENVLDYSAGISTGFPNQKFLLTGDTEDTSVKVTISDQSWNFTKDLTEHPGNEKVFTTALNPDGIMELIFGDGIFGTIPNAGEEIIVDFSITQGELGFLAEDTITVINGILPDIAPAVLKVTNQNRSSGASNIETVEELRSAIPKYNRTQRRAVTRKDYRDIAELNSGVRTAGVVFNCGKTVNVYIYPKGGGVASQALLESVHDSYEETRMVTTKVDVYPAGELQLLLEWDIKVLPAFSKVSAENSLRSNLKNYVNDYNLELFGSTEIGNLYEIIENTRGVDFSQMVKFTVIPYPRIVSGSNTLNWIVSTSENNIQTDTWTLKFSSIGEFDLLKNGLYAGTYHIDEQVSLPEVQFKVLSGIYEAGNTWQFVTYPFNQSIISQEPSIVALSDANLKLNINGGI